MPRGATCLEPEKVLKDVLEPKASAETTSHLALIHAGVPKPIVEGSLFLIAQNLVGFVDLFELRLGVGLFAHVRMVATGEPAEGAAQLVWGSGPADPERLIVVALLLGIHHDSQLQVLGFQCIAV